MMNSGVENTNKIVNDLEDLELPPLTSSSMYNSSFYESQNSFMDVSSLSILMGVGFDSEENYSFMGEKRASDIGLMAKICGFCHKRTILKNMFLFENNKSDTKDIYICLKCSSNISDSRLLKDWEKMQSSIKTKVCKRCNKERSLYRYKKENKYCDYCLLKKKWARLRIKIESNNNKDDYVEENDDKNTNSKRKQFVECCFCSETVKINDCFKYFESYDDLYSLKYICLNCSINIKDWKCLRDWEDGTDIINGKFCCRCKKLKSSYRFKKGKSGCEYCSLKRKRIYLINKK